MATLNLIKTTKGDFFLQSDAPSDNADFSLFDIDGEGSGSPFDFGSQEWEIVPGFNAQYDANDTDSFWTAQQAILVKMRDAGLEIPEYAEIWA